MFEMIINTLAVNHCDVKVHNDKLVEIISNDFVHHGHEGCRGIDKSKREHEKPEMALSCAKGDQENRLMVDLDLMVFGA